ncbi:CPBP family intramembrane glutamic endopeptidase [Emticicia sp. 21SJ11W-3]|uniref:CPBP family intramembrane glutamic endopeptidase n=1 Tax=Emticicia sp. 21SJ11W-3 TaxID=2916755 RepID=UPI00209D42A0|nr:CPBP family intramembrane glutamic endopeptidase [Emticicia sp. 21SJ11W-3]UTA67229.1 CPBP family intramembrane metalloprotease [Emticicia sp. 21SJ11W-3]
MENNSRMYIKTNENPAASSVLIILGLFLVNFLVLGGLIQLVTVLAAGVSLDVMMKGGEDLRKIPNAWLGMIIGQGLGSFAGFVGTAWLYWRVIEKKQWSDLNFQSLPPIRIFFMVLLIEVSFMGFNGWLQELNQNFVFPESMKGLETILKNMEDKLAETTRFFTSFTSLWQFLLAFVVIAVIAGVGEELVFRGLLMRKLFLGTKNIHVAIWLSGFIFAVIHFQFYGILPRMMLGVLFGYLYYWTGNIWVPIAAHIFNNGLAIIIMYLYNLKIVKTDLENLDHMPTPIVIFSLIATAGLLFLFKNYLDKQSAES